MNETKLNAGLLALALAIAFYAMREPTEAPQGPQPKFAVTDTIPTDATLALIIDLARPGAEPLRDLLLQTGRELPGGGSFTTLCGYDPTPYIEQLALTVLEGKSGAKQPAVGVATLGSYDIRRVEQCAKALIARRGEQPIVTEVGRFRTIGGQTKDAPRIAIRDDGLVLSSEQDTLKRLALAAQGQGPRFNDNERHRELRVAIGGPAVVLGSLILEEGWLARIFPREPVQASPIAAIRGAALRVELAAEAKLAMLVRCDDNDGCKALEQLARSLSKSLAGELQATFGKQTLDQARLFTDSRGLHFSWELPPAALLEAANNASRLSRASRGLALLLAPTQEEQVASSPPPSASPALAPNASAAQVATPRPGASATAPRGSPEAAHPAHPPPP